jgi:hypothetical protein
MPTTLSNSLRVAIEIRGLNRDGVPADIPTIVARLQPGMPKPVVLHALDELTDWMVVDGYYDAVGKNRAGYCYEITDEAVSMVDDLAAQYRAGTVMYG